MGGKEGEIVAEAIKQAVSRSGAMGRVFSTPFFFGLVREKRGRASKKRTLLRKCNDALQHDALKSAKG